MTKSVVFVINLCNSVLKLAPYFVSPPKIMFAEPKRAFGSKVLFLQLYLVKRGKVCVPLQKVSGL